MESLGGIGYLENAESQHINIARLYRDVNVLSIWEGTTNVLGTDFVKTLKGRSGEETLDAVEKWVKLALGGEGGNFRREKEFVRRWLRVFRERVSSGEVGGLVVEARELMDLFANVIKGTLMIVDAERDWDAVSGELCRRFFVGCGLAAEKEGWEIQFEWDKKIVFAGLEELGPVNPHL